VVWNFELRKCKDKKGVGCVSAIWLCVGYLKVEWELYLELDSYYYVTINTISCGTSLLHQKEMNRCPLSVGTSFVMKVAAHSRLPSSVLP